MSKNHSLFSKSLNKTLWMSKNCLKIAYVQWLIEKCSKMLKYLNRHYDLISYSDYTTIVLMPYFDLIF